VGSLHYAIFKKNYNICHRNRSIAERCLQRGANYKPSQTVRHTRIPPCIIEARFQMNPRANCKIPLSLPWSLPVKAKSGTNIQRGPEDSADENQHRTFDLRIQMKAAKQSLRIRWKACNTTNDRDPRGPEEKAQSYLIEKAAKEELKQTRITTKISKQRPHQFTNVMNISKSAARASISTVTLTKIKTKISWFR